MNVVDSNKEIEKLIDQHDILLIYFANEACGVCIDLRAKVKEMMKKYPKIHSVQVDVTKSIKLSADYNIFTTPAIILFIEGKEVIREARHIGIQDLDKRISRYYNLLFK